LRPVARPLKKISGKASQNGQMLVVAPLKSAESAQEGHSASFPPVKISNRRIKMINAASEIRPNRLKDVGFHRICLSLF
jgi:hypothetical protein